MLKSEAIQILGGSVSSAAKAIGVSPQAVSLWPDVLTDAIRDRVQAALYRQTNTQPGVMRPRAATDIEATAQQGA